MSLAPTASPARNAILPPLRIGYEAGIAADALLAQPGVLAVLGFGDAAPADHADPRYLRVALQADGAAPLEVWRTAGCVTAQRLGEAAWASDGDYAFGALRIDEAAHGGIESAAEHAYRHLVQATAASGTPHVLRIWNHFDAINQGEGDAERYRRFCVGRTAGIGRRFAAYYPAATVIGTRDERRVLQIHWLAARAPGTAFENPRQTSAWRYPRQYGIAPPTFARALRGPTREPQVYLSGTAAITGHASQHAGDLTAQIEETLTNLASLFDVAGLEAAARFGPPCPLKIYVRRPQDIAPARAHLAARLPAGTPLLFLHGDVCRRELLIEIDGVQVAAS